MKTFIQRGDTVSLTAAAAVSGGGFIVKGTLCGLAVHDAAIGEAVEVSLTGVHDVPKVSAQAWTEGAAVYVDPVALVATTTAAEGNIFVGVAVAAAANPSSTGMLRLNGAAPAAAVPAP
ncbi:DUF2190 family protein [Chachezhania sediminis]|uniref:DUF2190 family protein n=1 Tax=Chachezhania sediminis TaxID=2599291 RepID=UPI00131EA78F|nr:DUF2190 family protein [Chachezhania sediminis]